LFIFSSENAMDSATVTAEELEQDETLFETEVSKSAYSPRARMWRRFRRHKLMYVGVVILTVLSLLSIFAPITSFGRDPAKTNLRERNLPPSADHLLGTDEVGRDTWARLVYGGRVSLSIGLVVAVISVSVGSLLGSVSGYFGGTVDTVIQRFQELVALFPVLILIIAVVAIAGQSIYNIMIIQGLVLWTGVCRLVRGQFLAVREYAYVEASRAMGAGSWRIMWRHIFPNTMPPVIVWATFAVGGAIMLEAGLSFIGLGVKAPASSWGQMMNEAQTFVSMTERPWRWLAPGLCITATMLAINFVGDALRDAMDPRAILD
jgi:peptide/nickel transport system permease protein